MKRLALENERAVVLQMAFRAQNVFGTFEERASPGACSKFLESPESFRAHFGWLNSLCIFKTKTFRGTIFKFIFYFADIFIFIPFTTYEKTSFTE